MTVEYFLKGMVLGDKDFRSRADFVLECVDYDGRNFKNIQELLGTGFAWRNTDDYYYWDRLYNDIYFERIKWVPNQIILV